MTKKKPSSSVRRMVGSGMCKKGTPRPPSRGHMVTTFLGIRGPECLPSKHLSSLSLFLTTTEKNYCKYLRTLLDFNVMLNN